MPVPAAVRLTEHFSGPFLPPAAALLEHTFGEETDMKNKNVLLATIALFTIAGFISGCAATPEEAPPPASEAAPTAPEPESASAPQEATATQEAEPATASQETSAAETPSAEAPAAPLPAESEDAAAGTAAAPPSLRYGPEQVKALIRTFTQHRRTIFSSSSGDYTYFMGGILTAVYDPGSARLTVTPQDGGAPCVYNDQGSLASDAGGSGDTASTCDELLGILHEDLKIP